MHVLQIVKARPEDSDTLTRVAIASKSHWGYPERWLETWSELLIIRPDFIATHDVYSAMIDGEIVGFYGLIQDRGTLRLEHLWVLPDEIGQGVGRALFTHALERARGLNFQSLGIESDPNAVPFYERMGARRVGANVTEFEGQRRELPVLIYDIHEATQR